MIIGTLVLCIQLHCESFQSRFESMAKCEEVSEIALDLASQDPHITSAGTSCAAVEMDTRF